MTCLATAVRLAASCLAFAVAVPAAAAAQGADGSTLSVPIAPVETSGVARPLAESGGLAASGRVQVAADAAGNAAAMWTDQADGSDRLLVAVRAVGGSWSSPELVVQARASTRPKRTETVPVRLVVAPGGQPSVLWGTFVRGTGATRTLRVSSRTAAGSWAVRRIAQVKGRRLVGANADLDVMTDGTLLVAWSTATRAPDDEDDIPAGRLMVTERTAAGWRAPVAVARAHGASAQPTFAVSPGGAAMTWAGPKFDGYGEGPGLSWAFRTAGRWRASTARSPSVLSGGVSPTLDRAGRLHLFGLGSGPWGPNGIAESVISAGKPAPTASFGPLLEGADTLDGWLGSGYWHVTRAVVDGTGSTVAVWAGEPLDVERGGYGTPALWANARSVTGAWRVERPDPLTQTSGTLDVGLSTDAAGQAVATWASPMGDGETGGCSSAVYRSVRTTAGAWSPRAVLTTAGRGQLPFDTDLWAGRCAAVAPRETGGPAPLVWWVESAPRRLVAMPVPAPAPPPADLAGATPAVEVPAIDASWADVRRAGGLTVRCQVATASYCSIALAEAFAAFTDQLREARKANPKMTEEEAGRIGRPARYVGCFRARATAAVDPLQPALLLPLQPGCLRGATPPPVAFVATAVVDVPGAGPVVRRVSVSIGP
ncbi:MAG: hypothetical protein J7513_14970 [Solirubrobacteraceae bacterium]|nr:hypothetical protein [Solirubrobacteraceae bacterium]